MCYRRNVSNICIYSTLVFTCEVQGIILYQKLNYIHSNFTYNFFHTWIIQCETQLGDDTLDMNLTIEILGK